MAMGALAVSHAQERVEVRDLPDGVRQTIDRSRNNDPVKEVTRLTVDGRIVYDVEIEKKHAPNPRLRVAEDGSLVRNSVSALPSLGDGLPVVTDEYGGLVPPPEPRLTLADLPAAVQETARTEARGRDIADIDHETWNGQPVYEIEFKEPGLNSRVYIGDDGKIVRNERRPGQALRSLFLGTQLEDTPVAVQETIKRVAGAGEVVDVDRKGTGAQTTYRIELREGQTKRELRIGADGKLIFDSRSASTPRRG